MGRTVIKAVICALDNLENLRESIAILRDEPIDEIIVVNNGSQDGTTEWLDEQEGLLIIHRENYGAGPGRNSGLDYAGEFDYVLMLDGGIRPLRGGTWKMLDYLERTPEADVIGVEIPNFETDYNKAWRRWPEPILDAYRNTRLSHTAYCLCRARAWDGFRFCEEGPFGEPGWGADDDEMMYQWNDAGIVVHVCTDVHPYRRASGSFRRLFKETGVWPNQYGSVYEKRVVWLQQNWPQHEPGVQWGEPWLTVVIRVGHTVDAALMIKHAHDKLRERQFSGRHGGYPNPYSIVAWCPNDNPDFFSWADIFRLRQHHGDTAIVNGNIVKKLPIDEATWTGDFRVWTEDDWRGAVRPSAYYYGMVENIQELDALLEKYNEAWPPQATKIAPTVRAEL